MSRGWWSTGQVSTGNVYTPHTHTLHISFDDPPSDLVAGPDLQHWSVKVRRSKVGGRNPKVRVELHNQGTGYADTPIPETPIVSSTGTILEGHWDADLLPDISGAGVEGRIISIAYSKNVGVDIAAVEWIPTLNASGVTTIDSTTIMIDSTTVTLAD